MSPARRLLWPGVVTLAALALTISLGSWQLRRLAWKEALIARIEERLAAPASAPPAAALLPGPAQQEYEYRRVSAQGAFDFSREALIFSPPPRDLGNEPGYLVVNPFRLESGEVALVERGFIPQSKQADASGRAAPAGETRIDGVLRAAQSRNAFTPADQPERKIFFTSDPEAIAKALGLDGVAPYVISLQTAPAGAPQDATAPRPVPVSVDLPNNHLSYAVTWFSLAAAALVIFALYARSVLRRND